MKNVCHLAFKLNGEDIKDVNSVKYLGHIIYSDSKDDKEIMRQCRQLYACGNVLFRKFYMCTNDVKIKLFSTFCSSKMSLDNYSILPKYCSASGMFAERL